MQITKRNGNKEEFQRQKIINAINKAFIEIDGKECEDEISEEIASKIELRANLEKYLCINVETIQDWVEDALMQTERKDVAKAYIRYRYKREQERAIQSDLEERYKHLHLLVTGKDEESNKENSNKDTRIIPTMRDYIAGFTCRELATKVVLPKDIAEAHEQGIIHFHDSDYSPVMPMSNCCLINLEDMLQNGTVISGVKINKPHSFRTACTIATQVITQVASSQYGGNTITLAHLAPFVEVSRQYLKKKHPNFTQEQIEALVTEEIKDGVQTIQYQLITMSTTNGQAPFTSVFMWINEVEDAQTKADLVLIIEEILKQRITGVPNEQDYPITIAFPKLLYVLDDNNITPDSKYWYLTELAAECSAKRLVPDYISAKKMRELKGDVYACMGCRSFLTPDVSKNGFDNVSKALNYNANKPKYWGRLT